MKYAYEKEIVLYAHHRKLDYFSTECIYSPEAFRGSARQLIKSLERVRPSAILDVVRSGEAFVGMVPEEIRGTGTCRDKTAVSQESAKATGEDGGGGCGSAGEAGEMAAFEKQLEQNETVKFREVEVTSKKTGRMAKAGPKKQTLGSCKLCGYMSSQELCKACMILAELNKNRPMQEIEVELDDEEEDASASVRRKMERLEMNAANTVSA